jgi:hypothetical protein
LCVFFGANHQALGQLCSQGCVTSYGYDNSRDNTNPNESILRATTIGSLSTSARSDLLGMVYAQPLYLSQITINGVLKNVVYIATEENYVYALDESNFTGTPLWIANLNNTSLGETAIPMSALPACTLIGPEVGITSTPVIDTTPSTPVLYVLSAHYYVDGQGVAHTSQRLNALDVTTGNPVYPALDIGSAFQSLGAVPFSAAAENQRGGLALTHTANNTPQIAAVWAAYCDQSSYFGLMALFTVSNSQLNLSATFDAGAATAEEENSGIWMAGVAPAIDDQGTSPSHDIFLVSGNGPYNGSTTFGNTIMSFSYTSGNTFTKQGAYTPNNWHILDDGSGKSCQDPVALPAPESGTVCLPSDMDLGSGGVILARPTGIALQYNGQPENFVVLGGGKEGVIFVNSPIGMTSNRGADPSNPATTACSTSGKNSAVQCLGAAWLPPNCCTGPHDFGLRGGSAFWAGPDSTHGNVLYVAGVLDNAIRAYQMDATQTNGQFKTTPFGLGNWRGVAGSVIPYPGANPVVSWNANGGPTAYQDAILWIASEAGFERVSGTKQVPPSPIQLYAYYAEPDANGNLDLTNFTDLTNGPGATKFMPPTVINGHIYLAGQKKAVFCGTPPCYGAATMWYSSSK